MTAKRRRLDSLLERALQFRLAKRGSCKGLPFEELLTRVFAASDEADLAVAESVLAFVRQAHAVHDRNETTGEVYLDEDGRPRPGRHAFDDWLYCLAQGWLNLPEKLPRIFWESFNLRYCALYRRCESCRAGFGNAVLIGSRCPLCGGRIWNRSLAHPTWVPIEPAP
jgi:hypothetical protein